MRPGGSLAAALLASAVASSAAHATPAPPAAAAAAPARIPCRAAAPPPFGTAPCPGVRPGALVVTGNSSCTLNFLFKGSDGNRYIGTAGHCTLEADGETVWPEARGPSAADSEGTRFGTFAYAVLKGPKDFALIRLDRGVEAEAGMCYFGGPTGINNDRSPDPVTLHHYGNGLLIGSVPAVNQPVLPARSMVAHDTMDPDEVFAVGTAIFGDSGSAVISEDGRAMGVLVAIAPLEAGDVITRLRPQVKRAEKQLGIRLRLQLAELEA